MAVAQDTQHLERLKTYWKRHQAFPSMAKLCEVVGLSSAAVVDGQVTVKYLRQQVDGRFHLQPANPEYADILLTGELEILGVVVASSARIGGDPAWPPPTLTPGRKASHSR